MHQLEPFYNWRNLYIAAQDPHSPFYGYQNSETNYTDQIYNFVIHPQWDNFGSETLFAKVLFADYKKHFAVIELFGEWNDVLNNDVMHLKNAVIDEMLAAGINQFILIFENVLNFHADATDYYEEWFDELDDGWVAALNLRDHLQHEMNSFGIDAYVASGGELNQINWRTKHPLQLFMQVQQIVSKRLY